MKKLLLTLMLALLFIAGMSQTLAKNDPLKFDADFYLMEKNFTKALSAYNTILKSEPDNADIKYKAGICYLNSEDNKDKAIPLLEDAAQKVSEKYDPNSFKETNAPVDALFLLGSAYRVNNQIEEAIKAYSRYKAYLDPHDEYNHKVVEQYLKSCELARTMMNNPVKMTATNLGSQVNNASPNFNAVLSGDGKTLLYTTPGREGYDIFVCTYKDSAWTSPRNITNVLGSGKYMKTCDLSYDGLTLLLTLDDPMNADIFISKFNKGKWTKAEALGKEINSKYNETHASLSTDGKILYFTSDRKGGFGDLDIYKSEAGPNNTWGKAVNMGEIINTPFNEETPFLAEFGDKLFFSSEGHQCLGGYDIFHYDFSNPSAGIVNVGYPLNTTDNDLFYVPTGDGTSAIYACRGGDSYGGRDIYRVELEQELAVAAAGAVGEEEELAEEPARVGGEEREEEYAVAAAAAVEEEEVPVAGIVGEEVEKELEAAVIAAVEEAGQSEENLHVSYEIQIMALKKPVDFRHFVNLSGIVVDYRGDSWYRYTLGNTTSLNEAESMLTKLVDRGYEDAFIRKNAVCPQFTIQVMAVPGPVVDLNRFSNLPDVSVRRGTDEFCRYTTGEFGNKDQALANLTKITTLGYRKAFVTRIP